jgi:hypothetical protein
MASIVVPTKDEKHVVPAHAPTAAAFHASAPVSQATSAPTSSAVSVAVAIAAAKPLETKSLVAETKPVSLSHMDTKHSHSNSISTTPSEEKKSIAGEKKDADADADEEEDTTLPTSPEDDAVVEKFHDECLSMQGCELVCRRRIIVLNTRSNDTECFHPQASAQSSAHFTCEECDLSVVFSAPVAYAELLAEPSKSTRYLKLLEEHALRARAKGHK